MFLGLSGSPAQCLNTNAHPCPVSDFRITIAGVSLYSLMFAICALVNILHHDGFHDPSIGTHVYIHTTLNSVTGNHTRVNTRTMETDATLIYF